MITIKEEKKEQGYRKHKLLFFALIFVLLTILLTGFLFLNSLVFFDCGDHIVSGRKPTKEPEFFDVEKPISVMQLEKNSFNRTVGEWYKLKAYKRVDLKDYCRRISLWKGEVHELQKNAKNKINVDTKPQKSY